MVCVVIRCVFSRLRCVIVVLLFFFKQKTAYEMCISDWSSDVCSSDLVHRRFIHAPARREAGARVANATLAIRNAAVWGDAGTACASDSTKFGAWDRNLMTEWHARYGGRGVMIYWHVEKRATCVYSQLKRCSSS